MVEEGPADTPHWVPYLGMRETVSDWLESQHSDELIAVQANVVALKTKDALDAYLAIRNAAIRRMHASGMKPASICSRTGLSKSTISNIINEKPSNNKKP